MRLLLPTLLGLSAVSSTAEAAYITPSYGIASTAARVGSQTNSVFTVQSSVGTPGTSNPNYDPTGVTGPIMSSVNATSSITGTNFSIAQTGLASANLATGQLKVGAGAIKENLQNQDYLVGTASGASFSDVLTFTGAIPTPVTVHLSMTVDGSIVANGLGDYPTPNDSNIDIAAFELYIYGANTNAEVFVGNLQGGSLTFTNEDNSSSAHLSILSSNANAIQLTLTDDITLTDQNRTIDFLAIAQAEPISPSSYGSVIADFEHTAALSIDVPSGLTYTSLSGVFLTQPQDTGTGPTTPDPTTVPEPAAFLPLLLGLLVAIASRERRAHPRGNCCSTSVAQ